VLEQLWLECRDENRLYFKGLIQIAGAFVHLKNNSPGRSIPPMAGVCIRQPDCSPWEPGTFPPAVPSIWGFTSRPCANSARIGGGKSSSPRCASTHGIQAQAPAWNCRRI
jgi:hypothetical protein